MLLLKITVFKETNSFSCEYKNCLVLLWMINRNIELLEFYYFNRKPLF